MAEKKRYRVLVGLDYATDPDALRRLRAGENVPLKERGQRRAEPGDIVDDIPPESVKAQLRKGHIEAVEDPVPKAAAQSKALTGGGEELQT